MKRYMISITEIGEEVQTIGRKWEAGAGEDGERYGYTPEIQATQQYRREIYSQDVTELDIPAVISVINGIQK